MDEKALEERLTRIEKMLAKLDHTGLRSFEILSVRDLKLELRVDRIEARISEFAQTEQLAEEAYLKTHPEAHAGVEAMKDAIDEARNDIFFSSLPTVQDHRRESKT
jgi:hypothetical protein